MICNNCGFENEDGAKVCQSCGQVLENNSNRENRPRSNRRTNSDRNQRGRSSKGLDFINLGLVVGVVLALAILFIAISNLVSPAKDGANNNKSKTNTEQSASSNDDIYQKALDAADKSIDDKDFANAVKLLSAIPKEAGDFYKQAEDKLKEVEDVMAEEIDNLIKEEDYSRAKSKLISYEKLLPNSKKLSDLKKDIPLSDSAGDNVQSSTSENEQDTNEGNSKDTSKITSSDSVDASNRGYDIDSLKRNNSYGENGNPLYTEVYKESDFLNKNLTVDAYTGEIKEQPSLDSQAVGFVNDGESVYVEEVYNDGGRYWLNIGKGWISSKLITGEFKYQ